MHQVIIVGAGPAGLCAAKTILQLEPETNILIVDAHSSIGGVWSTEKIYPGLRTNNLNPALDFSDFALPASLGVSPGQPITGEAMHKFLVAYADHFKLSDRIRLSVKVRQVSRLKKDNGWRLDIESQSPGIPSTLECQKLVIAVGSTNVPHQPDLEGAQSFQAPLIHSADLGYHARLIQDDKVETVGVLGGGKSAYDAVYLAATSGKQVEWIIRKSGRGPAWVFPAYTYLGPFRAWRERLTTRRIVSFLSPCVWNDGFEWFRSFFHANAFGKMITKTFWGHLHEDTIRDCKYRTDDRLKVLEPESSPFWYGTVSGVNSYEVDFHSLIFSGQVRIRREDIHYLSPKTIHLANEEKLPVDALITATGFSAQPVINFAPSHNLDCSGSSLGIPCSKLDTPEESFWNQLDIASDHKIGQQYPRLLAGPRLSPTSDVLLKYNLGSSSDAEAKYSPWRLYRSIAPPGLTAHGDRSLVFIGMFSNLANTIRLEIQCLWAAAYLFDTIPRLEEDERTGRVFPETSLSQRFAQLRAPLGHGRFIPDLVFDQLPYWDTLLMDLGLETRRKSGWKHGLLGWLGLRELFEPYTAEDYRGLVQEWLHKRQKKENTTQH